MPDCLGEDTRRELVGRHFEAEDDRRRAGGLGGFEPFGNVADEAPCRSDGHVRAQRALAHAGPSGSNDQVRLVQPAHLRVEAFKAGGVAGQVAAAVERALGHGDGELGGLGEGLGPALGSPLLGHLVQLGLGALDLSEGGNVLTRVERAFDQVATNANQCTEQRQIVDLVGEVPCPNYGRARSS